MRFSFYTLVPLLVGWVTFSDRALAARHSDAIRAELAVSPPLRDGSGLGAIEILYQNDLSNAMTTGAILLYRPVSASEAAAACRSIGEELLPMSSAGPNVLAQLNYLASVGKVSTRDSFWVEAGQQGGSLVSYDGKLRSTSKGVQADFPVLCSHTAPTTLYKTVDPVPEASLYGADKQVKVVEDRYSFIGTRDRRSFRFLGIPFADPPIGRKRFMQATPYTGPRDINATEFGRACIQAKSNQFHPGVHRSGEDCLTLNVFTTSLPTPSPSPKQRGGQRLKPVFFSIYGGSFLMGRSNMPMFDGGNMASRGDVVVVTINYRLGALGLLASGDDIPGNAAISDQIMALEWVRRHISAFGGDPQRVTIGGESAGAMSVAALLSSKSSAGLYRSAIMQSPPDFPWHTKAVATNVVAPHVARFLRCPESGPAMVECLQAVKADRFASIMTEGNNGNLLSKALMGYFHGTKASSGSLPFLPVVDNLIEDQWFYLLGNGTVPAGKVPLMIGSLTSEGISFIDPVIRSPLPAFDASYKTVLSQMYTHELVDEVMASRLFQLDTSRPDTVRERASELMTLSSWSCSIFGQVQAGAASRALPKTYVYELDAGVPFTDEDTPERCKLGKGRFAACHANDVVTIMGNIGVIGTKVDDEMMTYQRRLNDIFASFIRTTDPNPSLAYLKARGRSYEATLHAVSKVPWSPLSVGNGPKVQRLYKAATSAGPYPYADQCAFFRERNGLAYMRIDNAFAGPKP